MNYSNPEGSATRVGDAVGVGHATGGKEPQSTSTSALTSTSTSTSTSRLTSTSTSTSTLTSTLTSTQNRDYRTQTSLATNTNGTTEPQRMPLHQQTMSPLPSSNTNTAAMSNAGSIASTRKHLNGKQLRRKNRRLLHRLLKNPKVTPSFLKVIEGRKKIKTEPNTDGTNAAENERNNLVVLDADSDDGNDDDDDDDNDDDFLLEPPVVVIDVDEYIGLKKKRKFSEAVLSAPLPVGSSNERVVPATVRSNAITPVVITSSSASSVPVVATPRGTMEHKDPADDGWFEGSYPMSILPDDGIHLSEIQKFVRENMEYFSATAHDCTYMSGRRKPTVLGQVGIRCIHCARALETAQKTSNGQIPKMPSGAVSFPVNFSALYSLSIQKPQHHFDNCPNLPPNLRRNSALTVLKARRTGDAGAAPRRRMKRGISANAYWNICCRRLGLVELGGTGGLRFGRNLKLDLLPFDTVRSKLEQEQPQLFPRQNNQSSSQLAKLTADVVAPNRVVSMEPTTVSTPIDLPGDVVDILREAKAEREDSANGLVLEEDSKLLSDFMFLTVKQVALCHAIKEDFATRGKKTKLMRVGFAGFCCRHCKLHYHSNGPSAFLNSCRSFSSSRDNVASAVSNSFVLHLLKCPFVPYTIKRALQVLKKVHPKQMQQMPYGSQSRFFFKFWERVRATDKPKSDQVISNKAAKPEDDDEEYVPEVVRSAPARNQEGRSSIRVSSAQHATTSDLHPVSAANDSEARQVLKHAEESWDPSQNDSLILPEDRILVTDFVFLCMRQLKIAIPTAADLRGNRRSAGFTRMAGLCCIHCSRTQNGRSTMHSGRSFPSAPDNIAGTLNSSLYKHMLICPNVSAPLKRTIDALRKIHSHQCSSLPFGSQRRFFKKLFARLKEVPLEDVQGQEPVKSGSDLISKLRRHAFVQTNTPSATYWQCTGCRMVPFDYRAPGSLFFSQPTDSELENHFKACQRDGIYWDNIILSMKTLETKYGTATPLVNMESFFQMVRSVLGGDVEVVWTFMTKLGKQGQPPNESSDKYIWRKLATEVDFNEVQNKFSDLQKDLGRESGNLTDFPDFLDFLQLLSCNFHVPVTNRTPEEAQSIPFGKQQTSFSDEPPIADAIDGKAPANFVGGNSSKNELGEKERLNEQSSNKNAMGSIGTTTEVLLELESGKSQSALETNETGNDALVLHPKLTTDERRKAIDSSEAGQFDDA